MTREPDSDLEGGLGLRAFGPDGSADLGDVTVFLLGNMLRRLRNHLYEDGFCDAGDLVADLGDIVDDYLCTSACRTT